jgi:hypothetical protein
LDKQAHAVMHRRICSPCMGVCGVVYVLANQQEGFGEMRGRMREWRDNRARVWARELANGYPGSGKRLRCRRGAKERIRRLGPARLAAHMAMMCEAASRARRAKGLGYVPAPVKAIQVVTTVESPHALQTPLTAPVSLTPAVKPVFHVSKRDPDLCDAVPQIPGEWCFYCGWTYGKDIEPHKVGERPPAVVATAPPTGIPWARLTSR